MVGHRDLCDITVRWLQRPFSAKGHGCNFAVSECRSGFGSGEIPDAIGYRQIGYRDGTVIVEAKVSRADFLADQKKPHRIAGGMGNWRYFIAPAGLLLPSELPPRWGLLEVNGAGHVSVIAGAAAFMAARDADEALATWRHEADTAAEMSLLVRLMARIGDPEQLSRQLAAANTYTARLQKRCEELEARDRLSTVKIGMLQHEANMMRQQQEGGGRG